jgi:hypothetical protein
MGANYLLNCLGSCVNINDFQPVLTGTVVTSAPADERNATRQNESGMRDISGDALLSDSPDGLHITSLPISLTVKINFCIIFFNCS